jgi:hypothetical protein
MSLSREQYINKLKEFKIKTPQIKVLLLSGAEVYTGYSSNEFFRNVNVELIKYTMPFMRNSINNMFKIPIPFNFKIVYKENTFDTFVDAVKSICIEDFDSVNIFTLISIDGPIKQRSIDYDAKYLFKDVYDLVEVYVEKDRSDILIPRSLIDYNYISPYDSRFIIDKD